MIEVRLFAYFRDNRGKILYLDAQEFQTPQRILDHLEINIKDVAILLVNGRHSNGEHILKDKDVVAFFPPVAGG